jgi:hypothetical protein
MILSSLLHLWLGPASSQQLKQGDSAGTSPGACESLQCSASTTSLTADQCAHHGSTSTMCALPLACDYVRAPAFMRHAVDTCRQLPSRGQLSTAVDRSSATDYSRSTLVLLRLLVPVAHQHARLVAVHNKTASTLHLHAYRYQRGFWGLMLRTQRA